MISRLIASATATSLVNVDSKVGEVKCPFYVETRWSAKHDAVNALNYHYDNLVEALEKLICLASSVGLVVGRYDTCSLMCAGFNSRSRQYRLRILFLPGR